MDEIEKLQIRNREIVELLAGIDAAAGDEARSTQQVAEWDQLEAELAENEAKIDELRSAATERETRQARVREMRSKYASPVIKPGRSDTSDLFEFDLRMVGADETTHVALQQRAKKVLDLDEVAGHLRPDQRSRVERVLRSKNSDTDGELLAAFLVATSNPHYRSAFQKAASGLAPVFNEKEARAVREVSMLKRAMSVGTNSAGGYAVPVVIDPTVILTAQGSTNDIFRLARVETITVDKWKGLSSAGVTWKFGAEASASNDNSPTIAQPEVDTHRADGFIPYSIEIGADWPGFAEQMAKMLGSGYEELLAEKLTTGTGADTPIGIVSRLVAQTAPDVSFTVGTAGTLAGKDLYDMWARLPQRHRRKDTTAWMSSTNVQNGIRQLGTTDPNFTVNITEAEIPRLFGKEFPQNDYMDSIPTQTATTAANLAIVGDWQGYLVAQRAGMNIEFVPMLFDTTNNRPTGQRGWFAWARVGADVVDPTAFQLLQNKTS